MMTRREMIRSLAFGAVSLAALPDSVWGAKAALALKKDHTEIDDKGLLRRLIPEGGSQGLYTGRLSFVKVNGGEALEIKYLNERGEIDPAAWKRLSEFFRCPQTGRVTPVSPSLFLLLDGVHRKLEAGRRPIVLYSGYRSPAYNRQLRRRDRHVARDSYHQKGMAADISLKGVRMADIREAAKDICGGGVGAYHDFIHLDVGPVRCW
jgi:uncharacterized protein YcbK (DUF882 family)